MSSISTSIMKIFKHEMVVKMKIHAHLTSVHFLFGFNGVYTCADVDRQVKGRGDQVFFPLNAVKNGQIKESIKWR